NCSVTNFRVSLSGMGDLLKYISSGTFLLLVIRFTNAILFVIFSTVCLGLLEIETRIPSSNQYVAISPSNISLSFSGVIVYDLMLMCINQKNTFKECCVIFVMIILQLHYFSKVSIFF